jgi:hypothetical protein
MEVKSVLTAGLLALNFIGLLIMLAGVSSLQAQCDDTARSLIGADLSCHRTYRYDLFLVQ